MISKLKYIDSACGVVFAISMGLMTVSMGLVAKNVTKPAEIPDLSQRFFHGTKDARWLEGKLPREGEEIVVDKHLFITPHFEQAAKYATGELTSRYQSRHTQEGMPFVIEVTPVFVNRESLKTGAFGDKYFQQGEILKVTSTYSVKSKPVSSLKTLSVFPSS